MLSAHRGGAEEGFGTHSLEAIAACLRAGVDMVEFDVRTTRDRGFVAYHDDFVEIDGSPHLICNLTQDDVLAAAPGAALVSDVLQLISGHALGHVDLKDARLELEACDVCESIVGPDGFILSTLEDISVERLREGRPHIRTALSLGRDLAGLSKADVARVRNSEIFPGRRVRNCKPSLLALNYKVARLGAFAWARRHGMEVLLWTINNPALIRSVATDERYWAFTTDYPRLALGLRAEER